MTKDGYSGAIVLPSREIYSFKSQIRNKMTVLVTLQSHVHTVQQNAFSGSLSGTLSDEEGGEVSRPPATPALKEDSEDSDETQSDVEMSSPPVGPEHTYSSASKSGVCFVTCLLHFLKVRYVFCNILTPLPQSQVCVL